LELFGGASGVRDGGMIESALARPQNKAAYEDASLDRLAAAYLFGLAKNHGFVDGNKRIAFLAAPILS
jgi:death-on-curing protein